ncbi:ABC transporter ATP-binding protein [Camelimonas abortus]|uniref:ABC transporter ATP-binding protein n=1 Tax=Camelimonas abortus TaxID=1017184 RepID=A0ABV7LBR8_9HYPH
MTAPIFELLDVEKRYRVAGKRRSPFSAPEPAWLAALDGVRLSLHAGESVALVGESGSGKSTLLRVLLGLTEATDGRALFRGKPITRLSGQDRRDFTREVAMVYQDARGSLNPRMRVADLIREPLLHHGICRPEECDARIGALLARVGLAADVAARYPSQLSGGQARRVAIARGLASSPSVLIADEAVSGLDVSTQAQLLTLLRELQRDMGLTLLFITHDLGVAAWLCERIAVMYLGRIVETGPTRKVLEAPAHPYTRALRNSAPAFFTPIPPPLPGEVPSPINLPPGCRFAGRCPAAADACRRTDPALESLSPDHGVACLYPLAGSRVHQQGQQQ